MDIKIRTNSIYKRIAKEVKSSEQLNNLFKDILTADENIFASIDFGSGYYVWTLPSGYDWHKLSQAADKDLVREALSQKKSRIQRKLAGMLDSGQMEAVFSVPSDDYIFYSQDETGGMKLCLVAWDYQLPAKTEVVDGGFRIPVPPPCQDVRLIFKEAGRPASFYRCVIKTISNSTAEKRADENGCMELNSLCVGYNCSIQSIDKTRDFSFVVEEGKNEYVFDVTENLHIEVAVTKDGTPAMGMPVRITYQGRESELFTNDEGLASLEVAYCPNVDVIVKVEEKTESAKTEYPKTRITFDLQTPVATVNVIRRRNGRPLAGEDVIISVAGFNSQLKKTDRDGAVTLKLPFCRGAELSVETSGNVKSQMMEMENNFIFDEEVPELFSPILKVVDTNGNQVAEHCVAVEIAGISKDYETDADGIINLPEVYDRQAMKVTDLSSPSSVRTYQLDHTVAVYEFVIPSQVIEYYDIHVRHKNGELPQNPILSILQNGQNVELHPDSEGYCRLRKDLIEGGVQSLAIVNISNEEFGRADVTFVPEENDYEIILDTKSKSSFAHILKQVLMAFAVTALFAFAFDVFTLLF